MSATRVVPLLATALTLGVGPRVGAQGRFPPDSFTNLKVLPKTIAPRALIDTMRGFAMALRVRCVYCHVGKEGQPLDYRALRERYYGSGSFDLGEPVLNQLARAEAARGRPCRHVGRTPRAALRLRNRVLPAGRKLDRDGGRGAVLGHDRDQLPG
jgi:hypothetical protein